MRFREISNNRVNEQYALYMSSDEALRLRDELGELPRRASGKSMTGAYRAMHELFMQNGITNELPTFESELVQERDAKKGQRAMSQYAKTGVTRTAKNGGSTNGQVPKKKASAPKDLR